MLASAVFVHLLNFAIRLKRQGQNWLQSSKFVPKRVWILPSHHVLHVSSCYRVMGSSDIKILQVTEQLIEKAVYL
jgi:hypothetical protein